MEPHAVASLDLHQLWSFWTRIDLKFGILPAKQADMNMLSLVGDPSQSIVPTGKSQMMNVHRCHLDLPSACEPKTKRSKV